MKPIETFLRLYLFFELHLDTVKVFSNEPFAVAALKVSKQHFAQTPET